ncbi:MAG TPA: translation elongation factor Ts [Chthonomonadales bacterium]|nr:translation elongation factor Ts [Chthonomonadales bacterium]
MQITAQMVSHLREQTGAGMMECKKALTEAGGDAERARDILRSKGKAGAEKRAGRTAAEGVVALASTDAATALVELNSETDFVARNEGFRALAAALAEAAASADADTPDALLAARPDLRIRLDDTLAKLRENIVFRRMKRIAASPDTAVGAYVHTLTSKTAALVELGGVSGPEAIDLARQIAMHVAAAKPRYAVRQEVPADVLERERQVLAELTRNEGKPEAAIPKIVEGRLNKFYATVCLADQPYVRDPAMKVADLLKATGATLRGFTLYVVGQE